MAQAGARTKSKKTASTIFGYGLSGWLRGAARPSKSVKTRGRAIFFGQGYDLAGSLERLALTLPSWLKDRAARKKGEVVLVQTEAGPLWLVLAERRTSAAAHAGLFDASAYAVARDQSALLVAALGDHVLDELEFSFEQASPDEQLGALVGLELGAYRYKQVNQPKPATELPSLRLHGVDAGILERAATLGVSTNLARHLVNTPAAVLNPVTYAAALEELFAGSTAMRVDVWQGKKLVQERMGMLIGVGQGSSTPPALVHLKYRPKNLAKGTRPFVFVGKGITFDTGGLDLKTGGSMRLMKKDMGGSASLVGLAYWLEQSQLPLACDFYLAIAENSVDQHSFRPGDILTARSGLTIEIDNTDAEGRLVLGDALDVAIAGKTGADLPEAVIDLATLTGAMRVALGVRIAGLFANDDDLADGLLSSSQRSGEPTWRMPLYGDYLANLKSSVADFANSGHSRFGGAIVAALFLQRFVGQVPWAHVDMYGWTDGNVGGCMEPGGNGQCVQQLADFLWSRAGLD